jgi:hypothetical protein
MDSTLRDFKVQTMQHFGAGITFTQTLYDERRGTHLVAVFPCL